VCLDAKAVRKNPSTSRTSNVEVESFIMKWLKNAANRMGGRTGRSNHMKKMLEKKHQRAMTAGAGTNDDRQSPGDGADSCLSDISSNDDVSEDSCNSTKVVTMHHFDARVSLSIQSSTLCSAANFYN